MIFYHREHWFWQKNERLYKTLNQGMYRKGDRYLKFKVLKLYSHILGAIMPRRLIWLLILRLWRHMWGLYDGLYHHNYITLHSLIWFINFCIEFSQLNLVYDIVCYTFISLHYIVLYHILIDLEVVILWHMGYGYVLIRETIVSHQLVACYSHKYTLSLFYPRLLVEYDWFHLI